MLIKGSKQQKSEKSQRNQPSTKKPLEGQQKTNFPYFLHGFFP
uniref:Uncharacterized protein n=1 Tax=Rhizophora mucronata TaxID=61149 RepID=A0A2P2JIZ3_RHIMU